MLYVIVLFLLFCLCTCIDLAQTIQGLSSPLLQELNPLWLLYYEGIVLFKLVFLPLLVLGLAYCIYNTKEKKEKAIYSVYLLGITLIMLITICSNTIQLYKGGFL